MIVLIGIFRYGFDGVVVVPPSLKAIEHLDMRLPLARTWRRLGRRLDNVNAGIADVQLPFATRPSRGAARRRT